MSKPNYIPGLVALVIWGLLVPPAAWAQSENPTVEADGMVLQSLSTEDLDAIEESLGQRLGVLVVEVKPGSPAATAGIKANDVLFLISRQPVASAETAVALLKGASGALDIVAASISTGDWQAVNYRINMTAPAAAPVIGGTIGGAIGGTATTRTTDDPVAAYFDMMDFVRTQAWARTVTTPAAERQRVATLIARNWDQLGAEGQAGIQQFPQVWAGLKQQWDGASAEKRQQLVTQWQRGLLSPDLLYPPPAEVQTYRSDGGEVSLQYPADWVGALQELEGTPMLYLGPPGTQTTWDKVLDAPNSPPGALFAIVQKDEQLNALGSFLEGVRWLAPQLLKSDAAALKEISVLDLGEQGAVITYQGKFTGQAEEKFIWLGAAPFGPGAVVLARMGGPTTQAEQLVPALHHMLATLQLNPPQPAGGGGGVSGAWEAAWSRVDVAITKQIWAPSGN